MFKKLKGYRTVIFNVVMGAVTVGAMTGVIDPVPAETVGNGIDTVLGAIGIITSVGNVALRAITNTAMGKPN